MASMPYVLPSVFLGAQVNLPGDSLWKKFNYLHGLIVGAVRLPIEEICLHPDSLKALSKEMQPTPRHGDQEVVLMSGAVTHFGPVKIVTDELGVKL